LKCHYCNKNVSLPFKCPFCGEYFCGDHRLPENHACPELWKVKVRSVPPIEQEHRIDLNDKIEIPRRRPIEYPFRVPKEGWTSTTEVCHLAIGAVAVMAVGLSIMGYGFSWILRIIQNPISIFSSAFLFMFIFISHELAHKASAKHFGMWAEFRLSLFGIALTILSIISPLIKIISPGAVIISGATDRKTIGKIAFAGPLMNMILASFLFVMAFQLPSSSSTIILLRGAALSAWMAAFNLIPIGIFDGAKILWWSKPAWAASFLISVALSIIIFLPW